MVREEYKYSEITERIIGCAMRVHSVLGNGFQEVIYQRALQKEFEETKQNFIREQAMPIFYHDRNIGSRRVDFLLEGKILVELKAVSQLEKVHLAQALNYLEAFKMEVGLLINFGNTRLEFKRLIKTRPELSAKSFYQRVSAVETADQTDLWITLIVSQVWV